VAKWWASQPAGTAASGATFDLDGHQAACDVCRARLRYLEEHVRPMPQAKAGPFDWVGAVVIGAGTVLAIGGGINALMLLAAGQWAMAAAVFGLCVLGGGLGGLVYYLTRPLRANEFGGFLTWFLVGTTYMLSITVCLALAYGGWEGRGTDAELTFYFTGFVLAGVMIGLVAGYVDLKDRSKKTGRPWGWAHWLLPPLGAVGAVAVIVGVGCVVSGWRDRALFFEAAEAPQDIALADLVQNGHGANRHVRVTDFRYCDKEVVARKKQPDDTFDMARLDVWVPVVPRANTPDSRPPPVPGQVGALVYEFELEEHRPFGRPNILALGQSTSGLVRQGREKDGYEGLVVNGVRSLNGKVRAELLALAPGTDLDKVLVIDRWEKPATAGYIYGCLFGGGAAAVGGLGLLAVAVVWARRAAPR
jgi:hypothetical protein